MHELFSRGWLPPSLRLYNCLLELAVRQKQPAAYVLGMLKEMQARHPTSSYFLMGHFPTVPRQPFGTPILMLQLENAGGGHFTGLEDLRRSHQLLHREQRCSRGKQVRFLAKFRRSIAAIR